MLKTKVCETGLKLRHSKPVALQKAARIGIFALVNDNVYTIDSYRETAMRVTVIKCFNAF